MIYREFSNRINFNPSALGFGLMRLPLKEDESIDIEEAVKIVRYAIDNGVNYIDTAYFYHAGESERVMAKVLKDGYREKVKIADKMPLWSVKEEGDLDKIFFDQLTKLEVKKIDFYLLHALSKDSLKVIKKYNVLSWLEKKKAEGYIDYLGFSAHDRRSNIKKIIDYYDWDFCMLQFNLVDKYKQAGITGIKYAHQKGLGVIVMEPLRGGQLTKNVPNEIQSMWLKMANLNKSKNVTSVKYLLDWIWNFEEVGFLLSGMSDMNQVHENSHYANQAKKNILTKKQLALYNRIQKAYLEIITINCTQCNYCKICPLKLPIPYIFEKLNEVKRFENQKTPTFQYHFLTEAKKAHNCIDCKKCIECCPQKLDIPALLKKCSAVFDEKIDFRKIFK